MDLHGRWRQLPERRAVHRVYNDINNVPHGSIAHTLKPTIQVLYRSKRTKCSCNIFAGSLFRKMSTLTTMLNEVNLNESATIGPSLLELNFGHFVCAETNRLTTDRTLTRTYVRKNKKEKPHTIAEQSPQRISNVETWEFVRSGPYCVRVRVSPACAHSGLI